MLNDSDSTTQTLGPLHAIYIDARVWTFQGELTWRVPDQKVSAMSL